jgi:hypothetical protein
MFGNNVPSGPIMMLKAIGFDPEAIMSNIESAKTTATEVMAHFDRRLRAVEVQNDQILEGIKILVQAMVEEKTKVQ